MKKPLAIFLTLILILSMPVSSLAVDGNYFYMPVLSGYSEELIEEDYESQLVMCEQIDGEGAGLNMYCVLGMDIYDGYNSPQEMYDDLYTEDIEYFATLYIDGEVLSSSSAVKTDSTRGYQHIYIKASVNDGEDIYWTELAIFPAPNMVFIATAVSYVSSDACTKLYKNVMSNLVLYGYVGEVIGGEETTTEVPTTEVTTTEVPTTGAEVTEPESEEPSGEIVENVVEKEETEDKKHEYDKDDENEEEEDEAEETASQSEFPVIPIVIGGAAIILVIFIAVIAIIIVSSKKKKADDTVPQPSNQVGYVPYGQQYGNGEMGANYNYDDETQTIDPYPQTPQQYNNQYGQQYYDPNVQQYNNQYGQQNYENPGQYGNQNGLYYDPNSNRYYDPNKR